MYIEGCADADRLFPLLEDVIRTKPIILFKGGRFREGIQAAIQHTGLDAGDYAVWQALVERTGAVTVDSLEEMLDALVA